MSCMSYIIETRPESGARFIGLLTGEKNSRTKISWGILNLKKNPEFQDKIKVSRPEILKMFELHFGGWL